MLNTIIRTFVIYCCVGVSMRLMGKRQLSQLQPGELVITILISEIAASPITDNTQPLINAVVPLMLLISFEIFNSVIDMKSITFRLLSEGDPKMVIKNGKVDLKLLKSLRLTMSDILMALRQKDVFDIDEVQYAIVETNGSLSVYLKPENQPLTPKTQNSKPKNGSIAYPVVLDGRIIKENFSDSGITVEDIENKLKKDGIERKNVLLLTVDKGNKFNIIKKDE